MTKISAAIHEVRNIVLSMIVTDVILDSLFLFALSLLILTVVALPWYIAFIPFFAYLLWHGTRALGQFTFGYVEERVPELDEALRTAADHAHQSNPVVEELFTEVLHKLKHVRTSYFLEAGHMTKQIISITLICFAVLAISAFNVRFLDLSGVLSTGALFGSYYEAQPLDALLQGDDTFLYGEDATLAELGSEQLALQLTSVGADADPTRQKDIDPGRFENLYPDDVGASVADSYSEQIPRKYKDIVKNYFKNIPT